MWAWLWISFEMIFDIVNHTSWMTEILEFIETRNDDVWPTDLMLMEFSLIFQFGQDLDILIEFIQSESQHES